VRLFRIAAAGAALLLPLGYSDVRTCTCDAARPETMQLRECSLCRAADEQPPSPEFFAIRDASPTKPNRWLAVPRFHGRNPEDLAGMTPAQRALYWTFAIAKAKEVWGDSWGLAVNSLESRTQCHMHIHIGKLMDGAEDSKFAVVDSPADIPLPREGDGLWVHPVGGHLHVHRGNQSPELLLQH
jgi:hypothetical protein